MLERLARTKRTPILPMAEPHHSPSRAPYLESWRKTPGRQEAKPKSDTPPSSLLRRLAKRLVAAMAAPLAAFIGLYATGLLNEAFACITDRACRVRGLTRSPDPGPELRILPATLDRDGYSRQTGRVRKAGPRRSQHVHTKGGCQRSAKLDEFLR